MRVDALVPVRPVDLGRARPAGRPDGEGLEARVFHDSPSLTLALEARVGCHRAIDEAENRLGARVAHVVGHASSQPPGSLAVRGRQHARGAPACAADQAAARRIDARGPAFRARAAADGALLELERVPDGRQHGEARCRARRRGEAWASRSARVEPVEQLDQHRPAGGLRRPGREEMARPPEGACRRRRARRGRETTLARRRTMRASLSVVSSAPLSSSTTAIVCTGSSAPPTRRLNSCGAPRTIGRRPCRRSSVMSVAMTSLSPNSDRADDRARGSPRRLTPPSSYAPAACARTAAKAPPACRARGA